MSSLNTAGLDRLIGRVRKLGDALDDPATMAVLLEQVELTIVEDNRRGVLAGLDKDGNRMASVTYRTGISAAKPRARGAAKGFGTTIGVAKGFGPTAGGLHGNLSPAEYKKLTGPPLAPRGDQSRVIANLETGHGQDGEGRWLVIARWNDVVTAKGRKILPAHFNGAGRLPRRDLSGVRPWGMDLAAKKARAFLRGLLKRSP